MRNYSSPDMLGLVAEVNVNRLKLIANQYFARFNRPPFQRKDLPLLANARQLHRRFLQGDYTHEDVEAGLLRELCERLVAIHNLINGVGERDGQHGRIYLQNLKQSQPCLPGVYAEAVTKAMHGWVEV